MGWGNCFWGTEPWRKGTNTWAGLLERLEVVEGLPGRGNSLCKGTEAGRRCCGVWPVAQAEPREAARPVRMGAGLVGWLRSMDAGLKA